MADGILGLGSSGSSSLNQELIDELRTKEYEATVQPIETDLEEIALEMETIDGIEAKTLELLETVKTFDLYVTGQNNIFDAVSADVSGDSAVFDAVDTSNLSPGTTYVQINQLAQKDVYQSSIVSQEPTNTISTGQNDEDKLSIEVGGSTFDFETKDKTYEELVDDINTHSSGKLVASMETVGDDAYRLVIKSAGTGLENAINITQSSGLDLGFDLSESHTLHAQNMLAVVDGINYDVSSNVIKTQGGLSITGVALGESTIVVKEDSSLISDAIYTMVNQYNELVDLINDAVYSDDTTVEDKSALRSMMDSIKGIMFGSYGLEDEESLFMYGFSFDTDGYMIVDSEVFTQAINENYNDLEELFVGYAEKEGIGTQLKTYLDSLDGFGGTIYEYEQNMETRKQELEEEKEQATESLDTKYAQMAQEFSDATVAITQMENDFAALKSIIGEDE
jgi:flagellar hook-associated protein 2